MEILQQRPAKSMYAPDPRLVREVIGGDERASIELFRSVEGLVCAAIHQGGYFLPSAYDEEVLRAELTARIFLSLSAWDPDRGSFSNWVYGIARNVLNSFVRDRARRRWSVPLDSARHVPAPLWEEVDPQPPAEASSLVVRFRIAVAEMGRDDRVVVEHLLAGAPHRDLAARLGVTEAAAKMRAHRLRQRIRDQLDGVVSGAA